jgi:hypothetical protein
MVSNPLFLVIHKRGYIVRIGVDRRVKNHANLRAVWENGNYGPILI